MFFPGGTREQYAALVNELGEAHRTAQGRIMLGAGPVEGGWKLVQVWDSPESIRRFVEEHLRPAFARAGDRTFAPGYEVEDFPLNDVIVGDHDGEPLGA